MKATFDREKLLAAVSVAASVAPKKEIKPVLKNVKLTAGPDGCSVSATDMEVGVRVAVDAVSVAEAGSCLLPAEKAVAILREADDVELEVEATKDLVQLKGGWNEYEMPGEDPDHFPDVPLAAEGLMVGVQGGVLLELARRTTFCTNKGDTKFGGTSGVQWEFSKDKIFLVATDSHRLSAAESPLAKGPDRDITCILPVKAMDLMAKVIDPGAAAEVYPRPNELLMRTPLATVYSRLLEGRFPDWRRVMPKGGTYELDLDVPALLKASKQAAVMTSMESKRVRLDFSKGKLTLSASGQGKSKIELKMEGCQFSLSTGFDHKYLIEYLRESKEDTVRLYMKDGKTPVLLVNKAGDWRHILVPLQIQEAAA